MRIATFGVGTAESTGILANVPETGLLFLMGFAVLKHQAPFSSVGLDNNNTLTHGFCWQHTII